MPGEIFIYTAIWTIAGLAAGIVLPRIKPHLGYLALYFTLVLAFVWVTYEVYLRDIFGGIRFYAAAEWMLVILPWGGLPLALYWRLRHAQPVGAADPLKRRLAFFVGLAVADVVFLVVAELFYMMVFLGLNVTPHIIAANVVRRTLFPALAVAAAVALILPTIQPLRRWIVTFILGLALLQVARYGLTFTNLDNQFIGYLPFLAVPLVALARRKTGEQPTQEKASNP
jgi:hypothetical protein